jgi:hypothetical protein
LRPTLRNRNLLVKRASHGRAVSATQKERIAIVEATHARPMAQLGRPAALIQPRLGPTVLRAIVLPVVDRSLAVEAHVRRDHKAARDPRARAASRPSRRASPGPENHGASKS